MLLPVRVSMLLVIGVSAAFPQSEEKLTARELFYAPVTATKPAATPAKPAATRPAAPARKPQAKPAETISSSEGTVLQRVSTPGDVVGPPLALRYSLLKQNSDDEYVEVDPDTVFRSGDRIKVSIVANDTAHLYIVQQGSSKAWNVLFPNNETEHGDNRVERNRRVTIPAGGRFTFDDQPGTERLFIVVSRQAEPDLEKVIYDLSKKPAAPENTGAAKIMLAQNRIDDSTVNRLRGQMVARDLVFEKVDDTKPAASGKREKAMYYGTQDRSSRARIVVDLSLRHQ